MDSDTKNFWMAATWFVCLCALIVLGFAGIVWINRYMTFEHMHDHEHTPHTHSEHMHDHEHTHPIKIPEHTHKVILGAPK